MCVHFQNNENTEYATLNKKLQNMKNPNTYQGYFCKNPTELKYGAFKLLKLDNFDLVFLSLWEPIPKSGS